MPANVTKISALLSDFSISQQRIADAIGLDPVISSRILSLANSPIYALHGTITNLTEAVGVVGNGAIAEILLVCGVSDAFGRKVLDSPAGRTIWVHSLATGLAAREICKTAAMRGAEDAFSCGLLHDIGKLILLRADAPFYTELIKEGEDSGDISAIERSVLGFDHAELGAAAGIAWKLPGPVCHMIRNHHDPGASTAGVALAHILQTADQFVKVMTSFEDTEIFFANEHLRKFDLGVVEFEDIWDIVTLRLSEMTNP